MNEQTSARADWARAEEKGNLAILRLMTRVSLFFGRRFGRCVLAGIAFYYVLFAPKARQASRQYLCRALGRNAGWIDGYRHVFAFASTVHDRIYLLSDRFDELDIQVVGDQQLLDSLRRQPGALLVGAHMGSFEVMRAAGHVLARLKIAMVMYEENARKINLTLAAINPSTMPEIIPLGRVDTMLQVRERLDQGYLVGMLADRSLGSDPTVALDFLGQPALFPIGPFRLAAMLRRPVFFMAGLYLGGNRYRIHFEPLADFSTTPKAQREASILATQARYVERLNKYCRLAPYNWFNFFNVWQR